jgi:hypothetical protein
MVARIKYTGTDSDQNVDEIAADPGRRKLLMMSRRAWWIVPPVTGRGFPGGL